MMGDKVMSNLHKIEDITYFFRKRDKNGTSRYGGEGGPDELVKTIALNGSYQH